MAYIWEKSVVRDVATRALSAHPPAPAAPPPPAAGVTVAQIRALHRALGDVVADLSGADGGTIVGDPRIRAALTDGARAAVSALAKA